MSRLEIIGKTNLFCDTFYEEYIFKNAVTQKLTIHDSLAKDFIDHLVFKASRLFYCLLASLFLFVGISSYLIASLYLKDEKNNHFEVEIILISQIILVSASFVLYYLGIKTFRPVYLIISNSLLLLIEISAIVYFTFFIIYDYDIDIREMSLTLT